MSSYRQSGTIVTDHQFEVPLDHDDPEGRQISIYAREVVAADKVREDLPWLLFLQGGPGYGSPRPSGRETWLDRALEDYRVLLLDQRGTGRSAPANRQSLAKLDSASAQAEYLTHFRADSIVRDAELIRNKLARGDQWTLLGQSFGGFCAVTYLSFAPDGVREALITGGLPGLDVTADEVYRADYNKVRQKNLAHYARYPDDVARAKRIARYLRDVECRLPNGALLTVESFQCLGLMLGYSTGSDALHYLMEDPFIAGELSDAFRYEVLARLEFATKPLYAIMHEPCYAQLSATRWSAQRVRAEFSEFDADRSLDSADPLLFVGEMIYPWMFETDPGLMPLRDAANIVAENASWPMLYDAEQLARNKVSAVAAVYFDDMYVDCDLSLKTAKSINGLRAWVTNEYEHDGLRVSNGKVLDRLIRLARGEA